MKIFGNLFDFNGDGKLDNFEKAAEFGAFMEMLDSLKNNELISAGLDPEELSDMDYIERREALYDAGLDPDDYDFQEVINLYYANLFSRLVLNLLFVWPFKFIVWCVRKIRNRKYDIDFSDCSDEEWDENEY